MRQDVLNCKIIFFNSGIFVELELGVSKSRQVDHRRLLQLSSQKIVVEKIGSLSKKFVTGHFLKILAAVQVTTASFEGI